MGDCHLAILENDFRPAAILVCIIAISASALPTIYFNQKYYHDWSGAGLGQKTNIPHATLLRAGAETALFVIENLAPPIFPQADQWNLAVPKKIPPQIAQKLSKLMESPGSKFHLDQMEIEEFAGLGFGVSVLVAVSFIAAIFLRVKKCHASSKWRTLLRWSPLVSLAAVLAVANLSAIARVLTPYYALLIPIALTGRGHGRLVKKIWWRAAAFAVFLVAGLLVVISPARPLFPVQTILQGLRANGSNSKLFRRVNEVYSVYENRNDAFAPAKNLLPPGVKILGLVTFDDPETSLWRPFGSRRVVHVCPGDTPDYLKSRGVEY
ncbi:MAG: hypothetical protein ACREDS_15435, partial [Limisphaerales bacterium]